MHVRVVRVRKAFSAGMAVLMLGMGTVVPLLETADLFDGTVIENEHRPGDCPSAHDHTICTQVGANLSLNSDHGHEALALTVVTVERDAEPEVLVATWFTDGRHSRAPPLV